MVTDSCTQSQNMTFNIELKPINLFLLSEKLQLDKKVKTDLSIKAVQVVNNKCSGDIDELLSTSSIYSTKSKEPQIHFTSTSAPNLFPLSVALLPVLLLSSFSILFSLLFLLTECICANLN